jgi:acetylglutamate kinase
VKRILIKLGGTLVDSPEARASLAGQIRKVSEVHDVVVVHGGGKQMTAYLAERGVESRFVNGLRVTTPEVIDALLKVFAGSVNHELVAALVAAGIGAVGVTGIDAGLVQCEQQEAELGAVGRPVKVEPRLFRILHAGGFVPVVACVGGGDRVYNVNADQMAAACAMAWGADEVLFLTDVPGVKDATGATAAKLDLQQMDELIREGVATGGMQAKLTASMAALLGGVGTVWIGPGSEAGIVERLLSGEGGTRLVQ